MKYYLSYILTLSVLLVFSGCSFVENSGNDCLMPDPVKEDNIIFKFNMVSSNIGTTRSDSWGNHGEIDSEWPQFEDKIDVNNFAFYIFLINQETNEEHLVLRMTDIGRSTNPASMITGSYGSFTVTTVIPQKNLEKLLGHELSDETTAPVDFRIVILANADKGLDYEKLAPSDAGTAGTTVEDLTTYSEFMKNAGEIIFNFNNYYSSLGEGDSEVSGLYKDPLPMFGMLKFSTTEDQLFNSRLENRIYIGEIEMLRAIAKIRVIDESPKENGFPRITSVTVTGITNRGYQLPADASEHQNDQQVHNINYCEPSDGSPNTTYRLGYLSNNNIHFGYIPEQGITADLPVIKITAMLDANRTETYEIPMAGNDIYPMDTEGGFGDNIYRNHIYNLTVRKIDPGTPAVITMKVEPWSPNEIEIEYTDIPSISERIEWGPGTYSKKDPEKCEVTVQPWNNDTPVILSCSFKLESPIGNRWTAYLIPKEGGEQAAFVFTDKYGNEYPENDESGGNTKFSVSGEIGSEEETTLYIKPVIQHPTELNSAMLQIVVTLNGTTIEIPTTPEDTDYKNWTIIQDRE